MGTRIASDLDVDGTTIKFRQGSTADPFPYDLVAPGSLPTQTHILNLPTFPSGIYTDTATSIQSDNTGDTNRLKNKEFDSSTFALSANAGTGRRVEFDLSAFTGTATFTFAIPATTTSRTLTIPDSTTTLVGTDFQQTLTNKALTTNITINGGAALTATSDEINQLNSVDIGGPASGDVLTTDGTQSVSNKTLTTGNLINNTGGAFTLDSTAAGNNIDLFPTLTASLFLGAATSTTVVRGNLQVDGTTTTVNTDTLDVEDAQITVNKGGNGASADSDESGIIVETANTAGTLTAGALIHYDSSSTTNFKIGTTTADNGSGVTTSADLADISTVQIFTNKQLTFPKINGTSNLLADSDELNQLDGNTVGGTTTGDIVTIDDTQTLTGKTISDSNNVIIDLVLGNDTTITAGTVIDLSAAGTFGLATNAGPNTITIGQSTSTVSLPILTTSGSITGLSTISSVGNITLNQAGSAASLVLNDDDNSAFVGIKAPAAVSTSWTFTLPAAAPVSNGQVMVYDTDGTSSFDVALTSSLAEDHVNVGNTIGKVQQVDTGALGDITANIITGLTINNAAIDDTALFAAGAEASNSARGVVSTGSQTFAGNKTFNGTATFSDSTSGYGIIPLGAIVAVASNLTGSHSIPGSGVVDSSGWMYCNGAAIPASQAVSGTTPNLTDARFLMGSTSSGSGGGINTTTIATANLPSHTHGVTGTSATESAHTHADGSYSADAVDAAHGHGFTGSTANENAHTHGDGNLATGFTNPTHGHGISGSSQNTGAHSHTSGNYNITSSGGHSHTHGSSGSYQHTGGFGGNTGNAESTSNVSHTHGTGNFVGSSQNTGGHNHNAGNYLAATGNANHDHTVSGNVAATSHLHGVGTYAVTTGNANHSHDVIGSSATGTAHSHGIAFTSGPAGSGSTLENRPLYLTCQYLIRVL